MDYSCFICTNDMQWPTLFHCGDHLACLGCVWSWVQQSYTCNMTTKMTCLNEHEVYELKDLYYPPMLGKVKCPSCNRAGRCNDKLSQMRVSPTDIAKHFPGFGEWACPFCKKPKASRDHVMECNERTYICPNPPCALRVKLGDSVHHNTFECKCYRCPRACMGCPNTDFMTIPQFLTHQNEQHAHDIAQQQEEDEEDKDETYEEEDEDKSSSSEDDYYETDASSASDR